MNRFLNLSMSWIVTTWLLIASFVSMPWWVFFGCMLGAVSTVAVWVLLSLWIKESEE